MRMLRPLLLTAVMLAAIAPAHAEETQQFTLTIKDHKFDPAELEIAANKPAIIKIKNLDASAEEFESNELHIEKVIAGNSEGTLRLRALPPGRHAFVGEYHEDTAKGAFIAK